MQFARTHTFLSAAVLLALCAWGLYAGLFAYLHALNRANVEAAAQADAIAGTRNESLSFRELLAQTKREQQELDQYFVHSDTISDFLSLLQDAGRQFGASVTVTSVSVVSGGPATDAVKTLHVALDAQGTFAQVSRMLDLVQMLPYRVTIKQVALEEAQQSALSSNTWEGSYVIDVVTVP